MNERIVEYINILGRFCGKRDISELSPEELKKTYGIDQADVMVLFGTGPGDAEPCREKVRHCRRSRPYHGSAANPGPSGMP